MLYGISLLAGRFGTGYLPDLANGYVVALQAQAGGQVDAILVLGTLLILVGCASSCRPCRSTSGARTCSRGRRPKWRRSCRWRPRPGRSCSAGRLILEMTRHDVPASADRRLFGPPLGLPGGRDRDLRQPGRVRADQSQTAARLFDDRPRRLHAHGPGRRHEPRASRPCCSTWSPTSS